MGPAAIAGISALGSGINAWVQDRNSRRASQVARENTDKTIAANRELAEYSYSKNLEQWYRQNQYNSPAKQMERFQNAGLNPNLIYGQGSSGNASSSPQYTPPREDYNYKARKTPTLQEAHSFALMQSQTALQNAQAQKIKAETGRVQLGQKLDQIALEIQEDTKKYTKGLTQQKYTSAYNNAISDRANAQINLIKKELWNKGINPNDSATLRAINLTLEKMGIGKTNLQRILPLATDQYFDWEAVQKELNRIWNTPFGELENQFKNFIKSLFK